MPNWCNNQLLIQGDSKTIVEFVNAVTLPNEFQQDETYAILESLYPTPKDVDVYEWNCEHWGSKWADCNTFMVSSELDNEVIFVFDSAWSPPLEGIAFIASMFPTLEFFLSYDEPNIGFYGNTTFYSDGFFLDDCQELDIHHESD